MKRDHWGSPLGIREPQWRCSAHPLHDKCTAVADRSQELSTTQANLTSTSEDLGRAATRGRGRRHSSMYWLSVVLIGLAVICFLVEAFEPGRPRRVVLLPLGLAFFAAGVVLAAVIQVHSGMVILH
jgi:hypothetical protein